MSFELVRAAALGRAFDAEPLPDYLAACHVPFGELTGDDVEGALHARLRAYGRVGLVGPVGSGKSSIVRYVLRHDSDDARFAPVYVNVATEDPDKVQTPRGFLEVLVSQLSRAAHKAGRLDDREREGLLRRGRPSELLPGQEESRHAELGASAWLLNGSVAVDLATTLPEGESYASTDSIRDAAQEALAVIAESGRIPVLVADDTDRLLRMPDPEVSDRLFAGFFGEVLRMIVDTLEAGLVVAIHEHYRERDRHDYAGLVEGRIEHHLAVPRLTAPDQLASIVTERVEFIDREATWSDVLEPAGCDELLQLHVGAHGRSLRRTLATLKSALAFAVDDEAEHATAQHVRAAAAG